MSCNVARAWVFCYCCGVRLFRFIPSPFFLDLGRFGKRVFSILVYDRGYEMGVGATPEGRMRKFLVDSEEVVHDLRAWIRSNKIVARSGNLADRLHRSCAFISTFSASRSSRSRRRPNSSRCPCQPWQRLCGLGEARHLS